MYLYIYMYRFEYIHIYIYIRICTYIHLYTHVCICTCIYQALLAFSPPLHEKHCLDSLWTALAGDPAVDVEVQNTVCRGAVATAVMLGR